MTLPQRGSLRQATIWAKSCTPTMQMSRFSGKTFSRSLSLGASFERRSTAISDGASAGNFDRSGTNSVAAPVAVISRLSERRIAGSDEMARILWRSI